MTTFEKCAWKYCRNRVKADHSRDFSIFITVQWCEFHKKMYSIQCKLFGKLDKNKHHSDIANDLWLNDKKKYLEIQKKAFTRTKKIQSLLQEINR